MLIMSDEELQGLVVQPQTYAPAKRAAAISSLAYEVQQYRAHYAQIIAAYQQAMASYDQMQAVYQQLLNRMNTLEELVRRRGSGMGNHPVRYIERTVEVPRLIPMPMPPPHPAAPTRVEPQASRFVETPVRPISVVKVN
jgi:hypothetical protein